MNRQQTPDIMANLMSGIVSIIDVEQENHKAIKQPSNREVKPESKEPHREDIESNKTIKLANNKEVTEEPKEKATFNLSLSTLETLEDAWIKLKRQFKGEQRITKTAIVEMALELAIEDLEANNTGSKLFKRLADSKQRPHQ
jgi:hypothetical protein